MSSVAIHSIPRMATINVSLPGSLEEFVGERVRLLGYGTSSEYVCDLIRRDRDRTKLRDLLLEGASGPPTKEVGRSYFEELRRSVIERNRS